MPINWTAANGRGSKGQFADWNCALAGHFISKWGNVITKHQGFDQVVTLLDDIQDYYDNNSIELIKHYKLEF